MKTSSISDTKNQLSALIHEVEHGETIIIMDRGRPVARLVSFNDAAGPLDDGGRLSRLEKSGALRRADAVLDPGFPENLPQIPDGSGGVLDALLEERRSGR